MDEFTPWVTPLYAVLYKGPFRVGGLMVFAEDEQACQECKTLSLECFYGVTGVSEVRTTEDMD